jgi:hypothetical protein
MSGVPYMNYADVYKFFSTLFSKSVGEQGWT